MAVSQSSNGFLKGHLCKLGLAFVHEGYADQGGFLGTFIGVLQPDPPNLSVNLVRRCGIWRRFKRRKECVEARILLIGGGWRCQQYER